MASSPAWPIHYINSLQRLLLPVGALEKMSGLSVFHGPLDGLLDARLNNLQFVVTRVSMPFWRSIIRSKRFIHRKCFMCVKLVNNYVKSFHVFHLSYEVIG